MFDREVSSEGVMIRRQNGQAATVPIWLLSLGADRRTETGFPRWLNPLASHRSCQVWPGNWLRWCRRSRAPPLRFHRLSADFVGHVVRTACAISAMEARVRSPCGRGGAAGGGAGAGGTPAKLAVALPARPGAGAAADPHTPLSVPP